MLAIAVKNLVKSYIGRKAVNGISFDVKKGETFALLGPNGAGKTSTIEILEGYRKADSGDISVLGLNPQSDGSELRRRIGLVLQSTALEPELSVDETITAFARLYPNARDRQSVLADVDLAHLADTRVGNLSGGQKRRLEIALGIVGDPELVFLDEPTTGLDPEARRKIWSLIRRLNASGCTIVLSSHYMDEVQALSNHMAIMVNGHIVAEGRPDDLQRMHCKHTTIRLETDGMIPADLPANLKKLATLKAGQLELIVDDPTVALASLSHWASRDGNDLSSISVTPQSLEDIYLELVSSPAEPHGDNA